MPDPPPSLDELIFEYLEAHERSERDAAACLARLKASSSDGGVALESAIRRLAETGLLDPDDSAERVIGSYRIIRRLARGGMGEVYLARPTGGGDEVALKLLRRELEDDPRSRARFLREVEIVQRLRHPAIAALLEAGEHRGLPYLVFERIDGVTLEAVLRAVPPGEARTARDLARAFDEPAHAAEVFDGEWSLGVARIAREVARALAHAHARGVVHRDVKPSNVMITPAGRVVLLDFGLASLSSADRMTQSGQRVGSLPFMAPETVRGGREVLPISDVYSLGVTLFELATLRSPFESKDAERLAVEIVVGPAHSARRIDRAVPAELDRCIACAMDTSPPHRYASAEAFASDLTDFLDGRPVRARSASWPRMAGRWARRRPARAAAAGAGALLVMAAPLVYALAERRYAGELERSNAALSTALERETQAKEAAHRAADDAMDAIHQQLHWFADQGLQHVPGGMAVRRRLVDTGLEILAGLPAGRGSIEAREWLRGSLLAARADLEAHEGRAASAQAGYREQERILRSLVEATPGDARLTYELGALLGQRGNRLWSGGEPAAALALLEEAEAVLAASVALGWDGPRAAATKLQVGAVRAHALFDTGDVDGALVVCDEAEQAFAPFAGALDSDVESQLRAVESYGLSHVEWVRALALGTVGDARASEDASRRSIEWAEHALEQVPTHRGARLRIATARESLGAAALAREDLEAAALQLDAAVTARRGLARDFPDHQESSDGLIHALTRRAELASRSRLFDEAVELRAEVVELARTRGVAGGSRLGLVLALQNLSAAILETPKSGRGALEWADRAASEAIELYDAHGAEFPAGADLWMLFYGRSLVRARLGDVNAARDDTERLVEVAGEEGSRDATCLRYAADAWNEILNALLAAEADEDLVRDARARLYDALAAALDAGYSDRVELETNPALDTVRDDPRFAEIVDGVGR